MFYYQDDDSDSFESFLKSKGKVTAVQAVEQPVAPAVAQENVSHQSAMEPVPVKAPAAAPGPSKPSSSGGHAGKSSGSAQCPFCEKSLPALAAACDCGAFTIEDPKAKKGKKKSRKSK